MKITLTRVIVVIMSLSCFRQRELNQREQDCILCRKFNSEMIHSPNPSYKARKGPHKNRARAEHADGPLISLVPVHIEDCV